MGNVLVELADKLGVLEAIKEKLFQDPKTDYSELVRALEGFASSFQVVDELLSRLLSLSFVSDTPQSLKTARELLIQAEGGALMTRAQEVRGHCNKLRILYDRRLSRSLQSTLSPAELLKVQAAFMCLEDFHENTLPELQSLMEWLSSTASKLLEKVDREDLKGADDLLKQARIDVLPQRQAISKAVSAILALVSAYVDATRSPRTA
jgi:hypothetical protein